ncbi:YecA family protein [Bacillus sp. UNC41MFS5]|uniref:YecA family protein n=1 Tax=Bacillus sp. UNC41MFS5 TaxID=1449046 RepID=UPI000479D895|nr:SEC-C domain-containing protein [Bacillus sp. UNC41MFS5]
MSGIGRNELCPCGSGKKYKKCHLNTSGIFELSKDSSLKCICGSGLNPTDCCGSFLSSTRRIKPSVRQSEFSVDNWYQDQYSGKVYFALLSTSRREWNAFQNFYIYGIEVNGRFFRPKTLDFVSEFQTEEICQWNVRCNLDYQTGAIIKVRTKNNIEKNKFHFADCTISVSKPLNQIEVPNVSILDNRYLRLFHHTSVFGYEGIINSKSIWSSPYDLQGSTRELKKTRFTYFTDLPELKYESDLFAVAMRDKSQAAFRTDDETQLSFVEIYKQPVNKREKRLVFYLDINLIAPVPSIFHNQAGTKYIEFFHPHIFRIGSNPEITIPIEQFEDGWKINTASITPKMIDVFPIANGNSLSDLSKIYQDRDIEP